MKNKDIEKIIYESFNEKKPELFDKILEQCPKMTETKKTTSLWSKLHKLFFNKRFTYSFASVSLVLVLALVLFRQPFVINQDPFSVIAIDVNPSVVLELDEDDKVIDIIKNNDDAEIIVGDMDLIGVDYNIAINALIGSMVSNGYISDLTNSVLLSIQSNDDVHEGEIIAKLTQSVNDVLIGRAIEGSVIIQELDFDEEAEELAKTLGISEAKAELILDIIELDPRVTVEELAKLSINDLNLYLESKNYKLDGVKKVGSASVLGIIKIEEAYQAALTELGLDESTVVEFEIELDQEDGTMVYEVEIETETERYEVLIDAKEGTVFIEVDDDDENFPLDALSEETVLEMVLTELGINSSLITELEIEQEMDNGVAFYEIEFEYQGEEYEIEVDALSGEIYSNSIDDSGFDHQDDDYEEDSEDEEIEEEVEEEQEVDDESEVD